MSSVDQPIPGRGLRGIRRVLDLAFGFFAWGAHFLTVYVATAVACVLGLGGADAASRSAFLMALVLVTVAFAALLVWHAWRRHREGRAHAERGFLTLVAIGGDAIALVAVVWQFFPIVLVPACA